MDHALRCNPPGPGFGGTERMHEGRRIIGTDAGPATDGLLVKRPFSGGKASANASLSQPRGDQFLKP